MDSESIVVVPWDFSGHSKASLEYALSRFAPEIIHVICVLEPPNPYAPGISWGPEAEELARKRCVEEFHKSVGIGEHPGLHFKAVFGEPADAVVKQARSLNAAFIVMSTHGRTGIRKLLMGSVAQKVVQQSHCPVVLLPNNWIEDQAQESEDHANATS